MDKRKRTETHDSLAEPMRREAQRSRPAFSETLDARLRAAVRRAAPVGMPPTDDGRQKLRNHVLSWTITAAASIALLVGSALFLHTPEEQSGPSNVETGRSEPAQPTAEDLDSTAVLAESTASVLGQWVKTSVDDNQWAGLDHDVRTAMATVTGPLPFDFSLANVESDQPRLNHSP